MTGLRDLISAHASGWLAVGGLLIGFGFGAAVFATNFCTMGGIADILSLGDWRRFRAWVLAAGTAIAGTQLLQWVGVVDLTRSMYLAPTLNLGSHIVGGLMFGFGMVFGGGCASRNLALAGGGDLRSLLALIVVGIFGCMAIGGVLGPIRAAFENATSIALALSTQGIGDLAAAIVGAGAAFATRICALLAVVGVALFCFADGSFRRSGKHVGSGIAVGLCVVAGWALTGLAFDEMAVRPVALVSLTYVRPMGDALEWLERFTAGPMPGFGVASVFGALFGAFVVAVGKRQFRVTSFADSGDTCRNLLGAALMGVGGVMALGCTIGQGVAGISTLALGSFLTFAAIVLGAVCGLRVLERWVA
jgi:uncharacterized protein